MTLKSAQIKRTFYPESASGKDMIVYTDYDEEIERIKTEVLQEAMARVSDLLDKTGMDSRAYLYKAVLSAIMGKEGKE
jgi:vacuolar-type H+-ATPase subunit H